MDWRLAWVIAAGTLPGLLAGWWLRVHWLVDARDFKLSIDADCSRPGGLATHVDDRRPISGKGESVINRPPGIEIAPAVGERVVGDVDDTHHLHVRWVRAHLRRMRSSASARDALLVLNRPRTADVVVIAPALRTPRIAIHRCSASTTTMTPRGLSLRTTASAICAVRRS